ATLIWIAVVFAFDPFLAFGTRALPASVIKPQSRMLGDEQLVKDHLFHKLRPETVIIGSSRSAYGIDPASPHFSGERAFNLAMLGAGLTELEGLSAQVRRASAHVRRLIIGVDHYMFFQPDLAPATAAAKAIEVRNRRMDAGYGPVPIPLQNLQTFLLSTKVGVVMEDMLDNWRRNDSLGEADRNGLMHGTYRFRIADRGRTFAVTMRSLFEQGWYAPPDEPVIAARLRRLAGMLRINCAAGLKVDVLLSPEHAMLHEAAVNASQQARREQLRRDVARLMRLMAAEQPDCLRYRDASGLFSAALEPLRIVPGDLPRFIEVSHYAPLVGEGLLAGFRDPAHPAAVGVDPLKDDLEADILLSRELLDRWRRANPEDAAFVKATQDATRSLR
ncbi:MAG: hypothetical protein ACRC7C_18290, partial [Beijerinckiaceae bacterium]